MGSTPADLGLFPRTDRFSARRKLGQGGMGVVYEAYDQERQITVALKTLIKTTPKSIFRLKKEFRTMAEVAHPNLVSLFDLLSVDNRWFFTMEYIDGVRLLAYTGLNQSNAADADGDASNAPSSSVGSHPTSGPPSAGRTTASLYEVNTGPSGDGPSPMDKDKDPRLMSTPPHASTAVADYDRVRSSLSQLVMGLFTLHYNGYVHQDIKPSNVLVDKDGRVVLMDFGVIAALRQRGPVGKKRNRLIAGTPRYMAPELLRGDSRPSKASDWYSVGLMVYEALTGWRPYQTSRERLLAVKEQILLPHPKEVEPSVPQDLADLSMEMINNDPLQRPSGQQLMQRLGLEDVPRTQMMISRPTVVSTDQEPGALFVGRKGHMAQLRAAMETVGRGSAVTLRIHGRSGFGKSTLVGNFLDELIVNREALVFAGRCYAHESVPFKAVDSLVDALVRHLMDLPREQVQGVLPDDVGVLAQLFPVLLGSKTVARACRRMVKIADPMERRRRGFAAFRALIRRLSSRTPVVLFIDDLQWGDSDSAPLLSGLMRQPEAPEVLLLLAYRSDEVEQSPLLQELLRPGALFSSSTGVSELEVGPLSAGSAKELSQAVLRQTDAGSEAVDIDSLTAEMAGNPYLISELVPYAAAASEKGTESPRVRLGLDDLLHQRISQLPDRTRRLLELVAISGRPVSEPIIREASGLAEKHEKARRQLRVARLLKVTTSSGQTRLEPQHDRVRETVLSHLSDAVLCQHHRTLLQQHEAAEQPDVEAMLHHSMGAADGDRTCRYATRAAEQAAAALAYNRAAELCQLALDQQVGDAGSRRKLHENLGEALVNTGHSKEAAEHFLAAVPGADQVEAIDLRRRAAMAFVLAGNVDQGMRAFQDLLGEVGMRLPRSSAGAVLSLIWRRLLVTLRGLRYTPRPPEELSQQQLLRQEACLNAGATMSIVDPIRAWGFLSLGLLLSLKTGHLFSIGRILLIDACFLASSGAASEAHIERLITEAESIGKQLDNQLLLTRGDIARGWIHFFQGRFREAIEHCDRAEETCKTALSGSDWEMRTIHSVAVWTLFRLGWMSELKRRTDSLIEDAEHRGDIFALLNIGSYAIYADLAEDRPDRALERLAALEELLLRGEFHVQSYLLITARLNTELYRGNGIEAWRIARENWSLLRKTRLNRVTTVRMGLIDRHGRAALAAAMEDRSLAPELHKVAARDARRLRMEGFTWGEALDTSMRAPIAAAYGDREGAIQLLEQAETASTRSDMSACVAACRRQRGRLMGGSKGRRLVHDADIAMADLGIRYPARFVRLLAPGFDFDSMKRPRTGEPTDER